MAKSADLDLIRDRTDIVELVREYVPGLKKAGKSFKGRCPFHDEKTPSFHVDNQKGLFHCFGCGQGGDIFDFVMKIENIPFTESVAKLAKKAGVEWHPQSTSPNRDKLISDIKNALEFAKNYYHKILLTSPKAEKAREYLKSRNIQKTTAQRFSLGFAPEDFDGFYKTALKAGFNEKTLLQAGLAGKGQKGFYDYFRNRIMFPITNTATETIGFGGRILTDGQPKYLNSPETPVFHKARVLFGLSNATPAIRKHNNALLLEGYTDVIALHKAGIANAVAPLGTAVGFDHARLLKRYTTEVVMLFDGDSAGIKASIRASQILTQGGLYVRICALPEGLDPDQYVNKYGSEKLLEIIASAKDAAGYHLEVLLKNKKTPLTAKDKTTAANEVIETISAQTDEIIKREWIKQASQTLQVDYSVLSSRISKTHHQPAQKLAKPDTRQEQEDIPVREMTLISCLLKFPDNIGLCSSLEKSDFSSIKMYNIFSEIKLAIKSGKKQDLTQYLMSKFEKDRSLITGLSVKDMPEKFIPQTEIEYLTKIIKRAGITAQLKKLREDKKTLLQAGKDVTDLQKQEMHLNSILKSSGGS